MKPRNFRTLLRLSSLSVGFLSTTAWPVTYVIQEGDTLSKIAQRELGSPVYGEKGSLHQILALNPGVKNPSLIRLGDTIELGFSVLSQRTPAAESPQIQPSSEPSKNFAPPLP